MARWPHNRMARILLGALFAGLIVVGVSCGLVMKKDRTWIEGPPYERKGEGPARVAVIYYSRSGNTAVMAREIARHFEAELIPLESDRYARDTKGWREAGRDASDEAITEARPKNLDLSSYELVFLGSPIWWYRPAPPLWGFVQEADLQGKKVVLFNTFNSRFKDQKIEGFAELVAKRGGQQIGHLWVRRGRVYWQKSTEALIEETRKKIRESEASWWQAASPKARED